jgi:hypothetical protein
MRMRTRLVGVVVGLVLGLGATLHSQGPFTAQIEAFWRLISTGGRTFATLRATNVVVTGTCTGCSVSGPVAANTVFGNPTAGALAPVFTATPLVTSVGVANGLVGTPAFTWAAEPSSGRWRIGAGAFAESVSGAAVIAWTGSAFEFVAGYPVCWTSGAVQGTACDTGISRLGANVFAIGNGGQGDFSATVKLGTLNAVTAIQTNGVPGATHAACSVSVTAITVTNGLITAITCS